MVHKFSAASKAALASAVASLRNVFNLLIVYFDHTILEGHRSFEDQEEAFRKKRSQLRGGQSKHNASPSMAVDAAPYPLRWIDKESFLKFQAKIADSDMETRKALNDLLRWYYFAGMVKGIGIVQGTEIRWGGDWDGDCDFLDQRFDDLNHFEVKL